MLITEIEDKLTKIIDKDDHDTFIYDFLSMYNFPKATITKLRKGINNLAKDDGEVYLKNKLYYKAVKDNKNLIQSYTDVKDKVDRIGSKPRYIVVTNFKQLLAYDTKTKDTLDIPFQQLPQKFEFFLAWNGIEKADFDKENPADIRAAERFAKLYDVIVKDNPSATREGLDLFLIRLLFCLFAEDTDIFPKNLFTNRIKELTKEDGSDLDNFVDQLFSVLDYPKSERPKDVPSWLNDFPYVDGDLFKANHESLVFTKKSRKLIIDAGELLEWNQINPDILGSMIQAVASEDSRSHLGMHYTSVPNIMKVIKPLFLDDLRKSFEDAKGNEQKLQKLYDRIGYIKFMDPACGSGNFLIITYKELRQLEIDIIKELNNMGIATMYVPSVTLDQFYGIEIDDFACDVTRLSLWIAEHQMNVKLHEEIADAVRPTLPLQHAGAIVCGNALRLDWNEILPHEADDEVYLFGNPPYLGYSLQDDTQKEDLDITFNGEIDGKRLDYISGWFYKTSKIVDKKIKTKFAYVTTNSINQGEQVDKLWPSILDKNKIFFAYPSFKWKNNASKNAEVIVSIIGIESSQLENKNVKLFLGNRYKLVKNINAYLAPAVNVIVKSTTKSIFGLPKITNGCRPVDDGNLLLNLDEYDKLIEANPVIKPYVKRIIGASEFLHSKCRYALWLSENDFKKINYISEINNRINKVRVFRENGGNSAKSVKDRPWAFFLRNEYIKNVELFHKNHNLNEKMMDILIPRHSSGQRIYVPMGLFNEDTLISDSANVIYNASIWLLGVLESKMHMVWLKSVGGKLKNDYRYSGNIVYNTFPVPNISTRRKNEIEDKVYEILDIREEEDGTLADLYGSPLAAKNPKPMNARLLKAHQELDRIVDRAYSDRDFKDDNERLSLLLEIYQERVSEK